jgi:translation initiation factor 3 subunit I
MSVTTTSLRQGKFETRFWHKVLEEEVGRVKGHFGPINTCVPSLYVMVTRSHRDP